MVQGIAREAEIEDNSQGAYSTHVTSGVCC